VTFWEKIINNQIPEAGCSKCVGGKIKIEKEPLGWDIKICDCLYEVEHYKAVRDYINTSNLPKGQLKRNPIKLFRDAIITYQLLENLSKQVLEDGSKWLYLCGTPGTGKTLISLVLAQMLLESEKTVHFTTVTDMLDKLRPSEDFNSREYFEEIKNVDLLILDDIGQEKSSQWVREKLYMLINHRYNECLPIIFTSNKKIEKLKTQISEAVYSRVKSNALFLDLTSDDKRLCQKQ